MGNYQVDSSPKQRKTTVAHKGRHNADQALLLALSCGATAENAARSVGVSARTVHRRLKDPEFCERLEAARAERTRRTADMLAAGAVGAVKKLIELQESPVPHSVQLGAARALLQLSIDFRQHASTEERLTALEQQVKETTPRGHEHERIIPGRALGKQQQDPLQEENRSDPGDSLLATQAFPSTGAEGALLQSSGFAAGYPIPSTQAEIPATGFSEEKAQRCTLKPWPKG